MPEDYKGTERRQHARIYKNYILFLFEKDNPDQKIEVSQITNISRGGICFVSTESFNPGTHLRLQLKTPYLADPLELEGLVLGSREKIFKMIFEIRLTFKNVSTQAQEVLLRIEQYTQKQ